MVVNPDCKNLIVWGANGETGEPPADWEQYYTQQGRGFGGSVPYQITTIATGSGNTAKYALMDSLNGDARPFHMDLYRPADRAGA